MHETDLLFIHALTGLHPGGGTALGVIDLPVQRERHTSWPIIPGSSLKGVMRASGARKAGKGNEEVLAAFGPDTHAASDHAGALAFSDARILAFPVRSLVGVFAWVTCPAVLGRLRRDAEIAGVSLPDFSSPEPDTAACCEKNPLVATEDRIMLEEFEFAWTGGADDIANWIAGAAVADDGTAARLQSHLAILHDDDFSHFVRNATEVVARVGLDYESKTVRPAALFYEEYLPAETLFYSLVTSSESRRPQHQSSAGDIMRWLHDTVPEMIQIGGGETVGKGFCRLKFHQAGERTDS